jgi:hypothetical protein
VIAYELLTGRHPALDGFGGGARWSQYPGVDVPGGETVAGAAAFLLRALSIDPAARPRSAQGFYDGLRSALLGGQ